MRIAAFADVHGNLSALEAVLADIATSAVHVTVDLGDLLSGRVQPRETAERLLPLGLPTVRGNHERQLSTTPPERLGSSDRLAYDALRPEQLSELASLPTTLRLAEGVTFRALEYDWERAARIAEGNRSPDIARALRIGRV